MPQDIGRRVRLLSTGEEGDLLECCPPDGFVVRVQLDTERWPVQTGNENTVLVDSPKEAIGGK